MGDRTGISWTDSSWNPVTGCSKVSPGCAHCYAEAVTARYAGARGWIDEHQPWTPANAEHNVILHPDRLGQPLRWQRPRRIFVNSMSDLFHEQIPDRFIALVFEQMHLAGHHTFQVLTKRPERMRALLDNGDWRRSTGISDWPIPNVWLGVSIENRRYIHRADVLRDTWAAARFISAEPLLGPLVPMTSGSFEDPVAWWPDTDAPCVPYDGLDLTGIDWLIVGGESGPEHRPMRLEWARDLRDLAAGCDTAFFMKQLGGAHAGNRLLDLPEDLRIRQFPTPMEGEAADGRHLTA